MNLSRHFTLDELTHSDTAKAARIDNQPGAGEIESLRALCTTILDPLRDAVGRPIKVTSGYRGPRLNAVLKGEPDSQHMKGEAADLQSPGTAALELFKTAIRLKLPFDQIIFEVKDSSKWVHVSYDPDRQRGSMLSAKKVDGKMKYSKFDNAQVALAFSEPVTRGMGFTDEHGYEEAADEPEHEAPMARGLREVAPAAARARIAKTPVARKTRAPKKAAQKAAAKKAVKKVVRKAAAKKAVKKELKKAAAKKAVKKAVRKAAAKKSTARKALPKSANAKKSARSRTTKPAVAASGKRAAARRRG